jgi:hypothetical protein
MDLYTDSIGQVLGNIIILVDLQRSESLWYAADSLLQGSLLFEIGFRQNGRIRLLSTRVNVTLKDPDGRNKVVVDQTFPLQALVPRDVMAQERLDTKEYHVDPKAECWGIGAKLGGGSHKSETKSASKETWSFQSARLANQVAQFSWGRTSVTDESAIIRAFVGAMLLRRGQHGDTTLEVVVSIIAKKPGHLHVGRGRVKRQGEPIRTTIGRGSRTQCTLASLERKRLNAKVYRLNVGLVPICKAVQSSRHIQWLTINRHGSFGRIIL